MHLAWLGADPSRQRIEEWRRHDLKARIAAANDAQQHGIELISDADLAALRLQVEGLQGRNRLRLDQLAQEADAHWAERLQRLGYLPRDASLRGFYALLYRSYSSSAHPSFRGMNPVVEDVSETRRRVVLERPGSLHQPYGIATAIYGIGLLVAAQALGWPSAMCRGRVR